MTHSEDYKRGLLDMLDALAERDGDGLYRSIYRENTILNLSIEGSPILIAIRYRKEMESRKALQSAINLLEENGYYVAASHLIPEYEKAAEYLRKGGYTVTEPGSIGKPPMLSNDQMIDLLWGAGYCVSPRAPGTERQQPRANVPNDPNIADYPPGHPLHSPFHWITGAEAIIPTRRIDPSEPAARPDLYPGSALHARTGHEEDEGD